MRIRTIAKLLILIMIGLFIFGLFRSCNFATSRPGPRTEGLPPSLPKAQPKPSVTPQAQTAQPSGPASQVSVAGGPQISELKPLQGIDEAKLERKRAGLKIWNVPEKSGDSIPHFPPVYSGAWRSATESPKYIPSEVVKQSIFERGTLSQITFLLRVDEPGDYAFTIHTDRTGWGIRDVLALRINDVLIAGPTEKRSSGYARLQKGFYRVDIRFELYRESGHTTSWTVAMKTPKQESATVISPEEMFSEAK